MSKTLTHKALREYAIGVLSYRYVARVYVLLTPLRLVLVLDDEGETPQDPVEGACAFEFYNYEEGICLMDVLTEIVAVFRGGFMIDTKEEEEEIKEEAETVANDLVSELESLLG